MPNNYKTVVFSFDGTGNEPSDASNFKEDESISNILKLHILMGGGVTKDNTKTQTNNNNDQITYYYNGIGTRQDGQQIPLLGSLISVGRSLVNMAIAPAFGDARRILNEAKQDFKKANIEEKDKVVVFGFSRGAALARKFVSEILSENDNVKIAFLGVFDTVAAMNGVHKKGDKISSDVLFEDGTLHKNVEKAVHIVSLDEDRVPFVPTLINKDVSNENRILEVWFPGVHSDIGGGYWHDGLSDITLEFMIKQCNKELSNDISIASTDIESIKNLFTNQEDAMGRLEVDDISINPMMKGIVHKHEGIVANMQDKDSRKVKVNVDDKISKYNPILHYSVKKKFDEDPHYRPPVIRGLKFDILLANDNFCKNIDGIAGLRNLDINNSN